MSRPIQKLLVIRLGALGDLVHLSAALQTLRKEQPQVEIHLLTRAGFKDLVAMIPSVNQFWQWPEKPTLRTLLNLGRALKAAGIDAVINLQPSLKTFFVSAVIGKASATYHKEKCRVFGAAQRTIPRLHAVEDFYKPFRELLPTLPASPGLIPHVELPQQSTSEEIRKAQQNGLCLGIVPAVGGKRANRAWPQSHWIKLLQALSQQNRGLRVLLIGGQNEHALAHELIDALKEAISQGNLILENHCGRWDIPGTATLMQDCDLILSGDTGPLHLAAGLGVPVLGLYGPTSLARTGPRGKNQTLTLTPPEAVTSWPCEKPTCLTHDVDPQACIRPLSVETVLDTLKPWFKN